MTIKKILIYGLSLVIIASCEDDLVYAPTHLTAEMISPTEVKLSWEDKTKVEDGFYIYLKTGKGPSIKIGEVGPNATEFIDVDLIKGTKYKYSVTCFVKTGDKRSGYTAVTITP